MVVVGLVLGQWLLWANARAVGLGQWLVVG